MEILINQQTFKIDFSQMKSIYFTQQFNHLIAKIVRESQIDGIEAISKTDDSDSYQWKINEMLNLESINKISNTITEKINKTIKEFLWHIHTQIFAKLVMECKNCDETKNPSEEYTNLKQIYSNLFQKTEKTVSKIEKIILISSYTSIVDRDFKEIIKDYIDRIEEYKICDSSDYEVRCAIEKINKLQDKPNLIVFIRGGGSLNEIFNYNDPEFINMIIQSEIPIMLGIGHKVYEPFLICNEFADYTAITPSEAARKCIELIEQSNNLT